MLCNIYERSSRDGRQDGIGLRNDELAVAVCEDEGESKYMYNDFHPNAPDGIGLYCYAVLTDAHNRSH